MRMPETIGTRLTPDLLSHFQRFRSLSTDERTALAQRLAITSAKAGDCLLELGSTADTTLYLIEGKVELRAEDGNTRIINAGDPAAQMPISRLRPSLYRVTARTPVRFISMDNAVLEEMLHFERASSLLVQESYLVEETGFDVPSSQSEQLLTGRILEDLRQGRLMIPSPPEVGERVGRAVLAAGDDEEQVIQALMTEPVLAAKMLQAGNRAFGHDGVESVARAVRLLGTEKVASAAVNCVLRESLRSRSPAIQAAMRRWWERSLRVSAISYVLARLSERFDPDLAATAGLLHRIGEPVLLCYANLLQERIDAQTLQQILSDHTVEVTRIVASMGYYGPELKVALTESGNPLRSHPGAADYADILVVADRHADLGHPQAAAGPPLDQMPAVKRLGMGEISPELSLKIMQAAKDAVVRANSLLGA